MKLKLLVIAVMSTLWSEAATVDTSLYILRDSIHFDDGAALPYATFNPSNVFNAENARIVVNQGDQLELWVVNFDTCMTSA